MLSSEPDVRLRRARIVLEGLSVGDALGGFFEMASPQALPHFVKNRVLPSPVWRYTDDTNMALSIYQVLRQHGSIHQDVLAASFAQRLDWTRGYGLGARSLLLRMQAGGNWRELSKNMFHGTGSYGNGAAMRITPLGAYFADDLTKVVEQAALSAEITHAHPEGVAGGVAVAVGAALACRLRETGECPDRKAFIEMVLPHVPDSQVKAGMLKARDLPENLPIWPDVVREIGNGSGISAQDTVPFVLWSAGTYLDNYEEAIWQTASAGGDVDTTCAMVGGIVAGYVGIENIPAEWIVRRELLPSWAIED
ncbi:MAG: ADP-ribosylglycohydrolase family protein [Anaerolineaceae bacterium]|nr:ADP-ribosylglycohydrolase family protein [Anaerolineaceae bacterium]